MAERERCDPSQRANLNEQMRNHAHDHRRVRVLLQEEVDSWIASGDTAVIRCDYTTNAKLPHYRAPPQVSRLLLAFELCVRLVSCVFLFSCACAEFERQAPRYR